MSKKPREKKILFTFLNVPEY